MLGAKGQTGLFEEVGTVRRKTGGLEIKPRKHEQRQRRSRKGHRVDVGDSAEECVWVVNSPFADDRCGVDAAKRG